MTAPLAELADLASQMQVPLSELDADTGDLLLDEASAIVRDYCRWDISPSAASTITLDSDGGTLLRLPCLHVTAVTTVVLDDGTPITDYAWSDDGLLARTQPLRSRWTCPERWPLGFRRVTVTYTGGYTPAPPGVKAIVLLLATRAYQNPESLLGETIGGYAYTRGSSRSGDPFKTIHLTENEMRILDRYKLANAA